jgi:hypothetical protein
MVGTSCLESLGKKGKNDFFPFSREPRNERLILQRLLIQNVEIIIDK